MAKAKKSPAPPPVVPSSDRRGGPDRRVSQDRRETPRPEGRRRSGGRRNGDPSDA